MSKLCINCKFYKRTKETTINLKFIDPNEKDLAGSIQNEDGVISCTHHDCFEVRHEYLPTLGYRFWTERIKGPAQLNRDGNCPHYKRKWWKIWIKS